LRYPELEFDISTTLAHLRLMDAHVCGSKVQHSYRITTRPRGSSGKCGLNKEVDGREVEDTGTVLVFRRRVRVLLKALSLIAYSRLSHLTDADF